MVIAQGQDHEPDHANEERKVDQPQVEDDELPNGDDASSGPPDTNSELSAEEVNEDDEAGDDAQIVPTEQMIDRLAERESGDNRENIAAQHALIHTFLGE